MPPVDQAEWIEVPVEFEVELDRPVCAVDGGTGGVIEPGVYAVTAMRHWAVSIGATGVHGGDTWFRLDRPGRPAWVRAAECRPYASATWD